MEVFDHPARTREWSRRMRGEGRTVAVVPTMGALHAGHLALIDEARRRADAIVVTIFVNPLQFNQPTDFDAYPRPIDGDLDACRDAAVDAVYAPTAAAMYPTGFQTRVVPGALADRLEGPMRPGHFEGVTTVVTKLFHATEPDVAVFGEKDYQQLAIVRRMVLDLDWGIDVVGVPIVREPDGLALSSRNVRLAPAARAAATVLSRALALVETSFAAGERDPDRLRAVVADAVSAEPLAELEYVDVVHPVTLEAIADAAESGAAVLVAAWFGGVRLIDNRVVG